MSDRVYLIHKSGRGWYRPESAGYTAFKYDAGRYTEAEAKAITHPNGESGPRDGMLYRHQDLVSDGPSTRIEALERQIAAADKLAEACESAFDGIDATGPREFYIALAAYEATKEQSDA